VNQHFSPLDARTLARALGGEARGNNVTAPGPGHSHEDRSLSVLVDPSAPDGFVVHSFTRDDPLKCRDYVNEKLGRPAWSPAPKETSDDIIRRMSERVRDLNTAPKQSDIDATRCGTYVPTRRRVAEYVYKLADGTHYLKVVRYEPKSFPQHHWTGTDWTKGKPEGPKIPYRLPEMLAAVHDTVFIVEGEKDADALTERGFVATTSSEGAGKWTADLNPYFDGKTVYILPDNDAAGRAHASQVAENLHGVAAEVRVVALPGLPEKGDVSDWLSAGGETSKLVEICEAAPLWAPDREERKETGKDGKKDSPRIGSAADLRRKAFPALRYVVPNLLAEGCTLLAGRPKLGKSWLMLDIGLAVAAGRICLGETQCEQGDVLYLALEDNERRLRRRIDKILGTFGVEWPDAFQYATEWPRANEGGVEEIRDWLVSAKNPRLVVVDVLMMFRATGNRDNQYEADYIAIKGLQALAGEFNVAIVIVHHTRKSGSDVDPFEKVSGTLGLSGAADAALILDRDGNGATLYGRGRDVEEVEVAVAFDKLTCRWNILGAAAEVRRSDERSVILGVLKEADEPMSPKDIMIAAELSNRNAIDILLFKMVRAGEVQKVGRGLYTTPGKNGKKERLEEDPDGGDFG
jgi:hypothetical protein